MKKILLVVLLYVSIALSQDNPVKSYYPDGKLESEISYNNSVREGEAKFYYEDGTLKEERLYVNGRVAGLVKTYHPNGQLKELINIEDGKREGPTSVFDEEGNYVKDIFFEQGIQVVEKKNIYLIEEPETKASQNQDEEIIVTGPVKKQKQDYEMPPPPEEENIDDGPAIFRTVEVMPEPVGSYEAIKKKLIYPDKAKEDGIEGIVEIEIIVDEFGEVEKADVVKGIRPDCDESARIAVYYTKFKPGLQRGKPVKVQFIVPVEFKIFDRPEQE
ncbi:MAG: TonB family protein [Ignavibacteria bacterium]|nr:TonB family protein [Ignavibacteria bacterium]